MTQQQLQQRNDQPQGMDAHLQLVSSQQHSCAASVSVHDRECVQLSKRCLAWTVVLLHQLVLRHQLHMFTLYGITEYAPCIKAACMMSGCETTRTAGTAVRAGTAAQLLLLLCQQHVHCMAHSCQGSMCALLSQSSSTRLYDSLLIQQEALISAWQAVLLWAFWRAA
jgi:hypothetical protein